MNDTAAVPASTTPRLARTRADLSEFCACGANA